MAGLCPLLILSGTKADQGTCDLVHDDKLRVQYEKENARRDLGYTFDLERALQRMVADVAVKIQVRPCRGVAWRVCLFSNTC